MRSVQDRYYTLNLQSERSSYLELYMPFGSFRQSVDLLHSDIKELLLDTMVITILSLDVTPIKLFASGYNFVSLGRRRAGCYRESSKKEAWARAAQWPLNWTKTSKRLAHDAWYTW